jgi:hypothetical protein
MTPDELIAKWLEPDPSKPGLAEYRVMNYYTHVWALIGHLHGVKWDIKRTADDYEMPVEAVEAAIEFHKRHAVLIEARIDANELRAS